jgi:hypothetical protein
MTNEHALIALSKNRDEPDVLMSIAANRATDLEQALRFWLGEPRYRRFVPDFVLQQIAKRARLVSADTAKADKWIGGYTNSSCQLLCLYWRRWVA